MNLQTRILFALALLILVSCDRSKPVEKEQVNESERQQPNIILILADDMGFSDLGHFGSRIRTPNLDKLAANGLTFTNFYNAGRCCPTRASMMTGLYQHQSGVGWMASEVDHPSYLGFLNPEKTLTIAELLKTQGYRNYAVGKWHMGDTALARPMARGFDRYWGLLKGIKSHYYDSTAYNKGKLVYSDDTPYQSEPSNWYFTDSVSASAVQFIDDHYQAHSEKPFFMYLAHYAPHFPLQAPKATIDSYEGIFDDGFDAERRRRYAELKLGGKIISESRLPARDSTIPRWEMIGDKELWVRKMMTHAAMITEMDKGIGELMANLKERGELDNTLILFLSDNGASGEGLGWAGVDTNSATIGQAGSLSYLTTYWAQTCNAPFRKYKSQTHEGGISTPMIAHWPKGIAARGEITRTVAHIIDVLPTLGMVGGSNMDEIAKQSPTGLPGINLIPVFQSPDTSMERVLFWEHEGNKAIREGDWKLVASNPYYFGQYGEMQAPWELYDMSKDPTETQNLIDDKPLVAKRLKGKYQQWADSTGVLPYKEYLDLRMEKYGKYGW